MKMGHKLAAVGHKSYNIVGEQVGLNGRDAVTLNSINFIQGFYKIEEIFFVLFIAIGTLSKIAEVYAG